MPGIVLLSACLLPFLVARAGAATEKTRVVYHTVKLQLLEVGDVPARCRYDTGAPHGWHLWGHGVYTMAECAAQDLPG